MGQGCGLSMAEKTKLTVKQQRFVDFYDGNATDAARKAGYKNPERSGKQNVRLRTIQNELRKREEKRNNPEIWTREQRQKFWTRVANGDEKTHVVIGRGEDREVLEIPASMNDRLKASEHLARSEADFIDRIKDESDPKTKEIEATGPLGALMGKIYVKESP